MTQRFPMKSLGRPSQVQRTSKPEPLPIEVQLGSNALKLTSEGWELESLELSRAQGERQRLEQETRKLRRELETCRARARESAEQANIANFENQILIDMLALARIDEEAFKTKLAREDARYTALSKILEQAYTKIIAAGLDPGVSNEP